MHSLLRGDDDVLALQGLDWLAVVEAQGNGVVAGHDVVLQDLSDLLSWGVQLYASVLESLYATLIHGSTQYSWKIKT